MIDKTIAYKNIFMGCDKINEDAYKSVPDGYSIKYYEAGDEKHWIDIHQSIGEFEGRSTEDVLDYFQNNFMKNIEDLERRCVFLVENSTGNYVGTCIAWYTQKGDTAVPLFHWLAVREGYENRGFGRVLVTAVMKIFSEIYPEGVRIYLHTQPSSYKAIKLYRDFGFCMLKEDKHSDVENEYTEAMQELKKYMSPKLFFELVETTK